MRLRFECPVCGVRSYNEWDKNKGLHFERSYDELPDLFQMEQRPGMKLAKPRFAQLIVDMGLRPVTFTRLEDLEPLLVSNLQAD
jgi:hypothetical protein